MTDPAEFEDAAPTVSVRGSISASRPVLRLRVLADDRESPVRDGSTIGTAPGADLRLTDPSVSRLHARFERGDEGLWIVDLGSTNGTWLDGVRIGRALVMAGARIRLGHAELVAQPAEDERLELWPEEHFGPLVGRSIAMRALFARLAKVAASDATVLVTGETGTGKDVVARAIHEASPRARGPFVVFDCGAVPEALFESELFGHVRGAFTGADRARDGAARAAAGGTLFLDEIGELPLLVQPKLLRLLETRAARRVGESEHRPVDVRVVAATHRDLAAMVAAGTFREDLYFRLGVLPLAVPPLRERRDDIEPLVRHFLGGRASLETTIRELETRPWAGNVRELRTFVERAAVLGAGEALRMTSPSSASALPPVPLDEPFKAIKERWNDHLEREYLSGWLARKGFNVTEVADAIGLDRTYVHRLMKKHGLAR